MMKNRIRAHPWSAALLFGLLLSLVAVGAALRGQHRPRNKWAWGTNAGWINFAPDNGGVTVYSDHLEGYAWGENIGWIRLGTYTGGGSHTYANDAAGLMASTKTARATSPATPGARMWAGSIST